MTKSKVWFVTGASKGLGLSLVKRLLSQGYKVAATSRTRTALSAAVGEHANFLPLEVDLSSEESVGKAVTAAVAKFGRLDVIVNNAGYGQGGSVEEVTDKEARANFETNVFGLLNVVRATSPVLREQRSGLVYNISSIGGFTGAFSGWGIYCGTKFAVSGITEGLNADLKDFGANATIVYPGYFRTNFLDKDSMRQPTQPIAAYTSSRDSMKAHSEQINNNQPGDPDKAADAMIQVAEAGNPPLHLFLGTDAFGRAQDKLKELQRDISRMESLSKSTDF